MYTTDGLRNHRIKSIKQIAGQLPPKGLCAAIFDRLQSQLSERLSTKKCAKSSSRAQQRDVRTGRVEEVAGDHPLARPAQNAGGRRPAPANLVARGNGTPLFARRREYVANDKQRFEEAVHRHCPLFAKDKPEPKPPLERALERLIKVTATSSEWDHVMVSLRRAREVGRAGEEQDKEGGVIDFQGPGTNAGHTTCNFCGASVFIFYRTSI